MLLQQCLPFTVLKPCDNAQIILLSPIGVATVLTVYGIETLPLINRLANTGRFCCNSAYRLRY